VKTTIKALLVIALVSLFAIAVIGCEERGKPVTSANDVHKYTATARDVKKVDNAVSESTTSTPERVAKSISVTLYFSDDQAEYLVPENRSIEETAAVARAALEELVKGPAERGHHATIPSETKILDVDINQHIAYVNFSHELIDKHWGGSTGELMTISSIVDTLTEFKSIQKVQILVEGKVVETITGHSDVSKPLARYETIIKK
jgi:spore germination protein GerM